jgi:hypothetical protein
MAWGPKISMIGMFTTSITPVPRVESTSSWASVAMSGELAARMSRQ